MVISKDYIKNTLYNNPFLWKGIEFFQGVQYAFQYLYYYRLPVKATSIKELSIEFSSQCNLRCTFCSLDHEKPRQFIEEETLENALQQVIADKRFKNIEKILLYNGGETLLHPKRIELLELVKKYRDIALAKGGKFPKVMLLSNATLLKERMSKKILDLDIIDEMLVSLDGGSPEEFEEMRKRAKWPVFYKNLKDFIQYKNNTKSKTRLKTITIVPDDKDFSLDWMHPEFREILDLADSNELRRLHNWAGDIELEGKNKSHKLGCTLLMKQLVLLPDGKVTVCCSDLNGKGVIGNLKESSLFDIYQSPKRKSWLKSLFKNRKFEIDLCANCETF